MTRVLWLSPWLRSLSRVQADALRRRGHEVLLVTSDQHPESGPVRSGELVIVPSPKRADSWPQFGRALRTVRDFRADVVVTELVRDPRWMLFARGLPRVSIVHDHHPHDAGEQRPRWERALFDGWSRRADAVVAFSRHVGDAIGATHVLPLPSDLDPAEVPPVAPAAERRDVVLAGRLSAYKNLPVVLEAWRRHTSGPHWRGDELVLLGAGDEQASPPPHVRHLDGAYRYADVVPVLHRAKASIVHYRVATQSGVQVLSMQLGVVPIASTEGALPAFQPPGEAAIGVDDVAGLTAALDSLADPVAAAERGARARKHHDATFAVDLVADRWDAVLADAVSRAAIGPRTSTARRGRRTRR